jgi:opacity protein-like surface antigen
MKKLALSTLAFFALGNTISAADPSLFPSAVTMMGGYTIAAEESRLNNNRSYSFRFTQNDFGVDNFGLGAFQLALDYTPDASYKDNNSKTTSIKFGPNLLWYLSNSSELTPYLLMGLGVEHLSNPTGGFNTLDFYANGGAGFEYQLRSDISFVGEAKYSYSDQKRKGTTMGCGLKFSFGDY